MITSTSNTQVKNIISLIKKSGERNSRGLFVIEGIRMFSEIPKERIVKVYASESFAYNNKKMLCEYDYEIVSNAVYDRMSDTKTPQGILAVVKMPDYKLEDLLPKDKVPLLVVLENIQDPGNLGTIIRTAEGILLVKRLSANLTMFWEQSDCLSSHCLSVSEFAKKAIYKRRTKTRKMPCL